MPRSPAALINGVLDLFPTDVAHTGICADIIAVGASLVTLADGLGMNCAGGGNSLHPFSVLILFLILGASISVKYIG